MKDQWTEAALAADLKAVLKDMVDRSAPRSGDIFVVGCSTSEVQGRRIGKAGSPAVADVFYPVLGDFAKEYHLRLAFQCCEHLNRALVVSRETAIIENLTEVSVIPHYRAGGSMATCAYRRMRDPLVVEDLGHRAGYGIDIGLTMIGMHMRPVAVPMRLAHHTIGDAQVACAFSRPKLIGGERARYTLGEADAYQDEGKKA